jgi:hypothetical protein
MCRTDSKKKKASHPRGRPANLLSHQNLQQHRYRYDNGRCIDFDGNNDDADLSPHNGEPFPGRDRPQTQRGLRCRPSERTISSRRSRVSGPPLAFMNRRW